jgi:sialidase-1
MYKFLSGIIVIMVLMANYSCHISNLNITVKTKQFQVPVLKNLDHNPLFRLNLDVHDSIEQAQVISLTINLKETDDLSDIESLSVWYTGNDSMWTPRSRPVLFCTERASGTTVTFQGNQKINFGTSCFFVTCKLSGNADLHHKISASCHKVKYDNKTFSEPVNMYPLLKQRIGVAVRKHMDDNVHTYRIPGLATTNKGTLLANYDIRRERSRDLQGDIDIGISQSTNGGNTWEPMQIGLDMGEWGKLPEKFNGVSDACILVDKNSDNIFLAGLWMHGVINKDGIWIEELTSDSKDWNHQWRTKGSQPGFGEKQTSQFLITTSNDDGKTWSEPVNITEMCKKEEWWLFAPAPGHGITLNDGTLVFPTQGRDKNGKCFSNITCSNDGGLTWTTSNPAYSNTTESMAVQLNDGSIMLNMRYNNNRSNSSNTNGRVIATTKDLGEVWKEHHSSRSALIESTCMASIHKHFYYENSVKKSILLFSNPNTKKGRHHMTIKVSFDDGETWPEKHWMLLDEGKSRGYSCLTSIDNNTIGILYEGSQANITFESIPLGELIPEFN